jgi:hypothetical protein
MVSVAIVVFPVCLFQIINSLCHLHIGTIASIDLIPVSNGTFTDFLVSTQGAIFSTNQYFLGLILLPPSIGSQIPFKTLQRYSSHTPTLKTRPVESTVSPCLRLV